MLPVRAAGDTLARHRISSASRFPTPAIADWSSSRALTATEPRVISSRNSARVTSAASGPSASMSGFSRTRPSRRLSNSARLPPSAKLRVKRSHSGLRGCASRRRGSPAPAARPSAAVTTIRPPMPRWMPRSGPPSEVSHHIALPRRRAPVSSLPISAARSSPGECGRHTNVSLSSTSAMRRCSASSAIRLRAVSTSGSSGTLSLYSPGRPRTEDPVLSRSLRSSAVGAGGRPCVFERSGRQDGREPVRGPVELSQDVLPCRGAERGVGERDLLLQDRDQRRVLPG